MARKKVEVFLDESYIEILQQISNNRSEAIRLCVEYICDNVDSGMLCKEDLI